MSRNPSQSPSVTPTGHLSASPSMQNLKRDKRRIQLAEKTNQFVNMFESSLRSHYEAQAKAIQVDINLILAANPYEGPLDDNQESIVKMIYDDLLCGKTVVDPSVENDFIANVGRWYEAFAWEVNKKLEERDAALAMLAQEYEYRMEEIDRRHNFHVLLAQKEHKILSNTIRERLVSQLVSKRQRLIREKEQLDLADSSALLLHPNQYCVTIPLSPGGAQSYRKTRHTRQRGVDDDLPSVSNVSSDSKRKRRTNLDDGSASPPSNKRTTESGGRSTIRESRQRMLYSQYDAPAYSINRLFTERELALTMNRAALAASDFLIKLQQQQSSNDSTAKTNGKVDKSGSDGIDLDSISFVARNDADENDSAILPEMMDIDTTNRQSTNRSTTRSCTRNGVNTIPSVVDRGIYVYPIPKFLPISNGGKPGSAPTPSGLTQDEIEQDLQFLSQEDKVDDEMITRLLESAIGPQRSHEYLFPCLEMEESESGTSAQPGPTDHSCDKSIAATNTNATTTTTTTAALSTTTASSSNLVDSEVAAHNQTQGSANRSQRDRSPGTTRAPSTVKRQASRASRRGR